MVDRRDIPVYDRDIPETLMASLYIRNADTADLARDVASLLSTSRRKHTLQVERGQNMHDRFAAWRAAHPLREPTRREADKAFYDLLNDEDDD